MAGGVEIVIVVFLSLIVLGPIIYYGWYNSTDHSYISDVTRLNQDATIKKFESEIVGGKGSRKFRTTVVFDDGFTYISHKTDVEDYRVFYRFYLTPKTKEEIIRDAFRAHQKAIIEREQKE